jgi:hypothetical protein
MTGSSIGNQQASINKASLLNQVGQDGADATLNVLRVTGAQTARLKYTDIQPRNSEVQNRQCC